MPDNTGRRTFLKATSGAAGLTLLNERVRGASDRIAFGFIGLGVMGSGNLKHAMNQPGVEVTSVCDVYEPHLERAVAATGKRAKAVKDFRAILADKSIDAVCISTPDHWHPYIMVEACKAGKDVYVEKPVSVTIDEGRAMVEAQRKYQRVVQVGTIQRSGTHFQKAIEIVRSGQLGPITFCRTWTYRNFAPEGIGNPPDGDPPRGLDWDLWLGPAPKRPFNPNRFLQKFRYFWDYAGGRLTDWGVHLIDTIRWGMGEPMPLSATAGGGRLLLRDYRDTPDTLYVTYQYPKFVMLYENRDCSGAQIQGTGGHGMAFHGTNATLVIDRSKFQVLPEGKSKVPPVEVRKTNDGYGEHWADFVKCIRTRAKPVCDIETAYLSTATAILGNMALRSGVLVEWDARKQTTPTEKAKKYMGRDYRPPWKLKV